MAQDEPFEIFVVATPGLENACLNEVREVGFKDAELIDGGIQFLGQWPDVWRANLMLRGATRILSRVASFRAFHLAQLDKRLRKLEWANWFLPNTALRVEATCRKSKIYHDRAAGQRLEKVLTDVAGCTIDKESTLVVKLRIFDDLVTVSIDTSGEGLHKRGHKVAVAKAPMRETMAALMLRECGYDAKEAVYDPMCGSGTFVIEAAEIAHGLYPGRSRAFAFQTLANFDAPAYEALKSMQTPKDPAQKFYGSDRDQGAVQMSKDNAERAGVLDLTEFTTADVTKITAPDCTPGLVIINPPYGARIGNKKPLYGLYKQIGDRLLSEFKGWRVGIVTSEPSLAKATGLPFLPTNGSISHGGLRVTLFRTDPI